MEKIYFQISFLIMPDYLLNDAFWDYNLFA